MIDLTVYKTARGAAARLHRELRRMARTLGLDPDRELFMRRHEQVPGAWLVSWESGPYAWAAALSGGESMYGPEYGAELRAYGITSTPEFKLTDASRWYAEPHYSFSLIFYPG